MAVEAGLDAKRIQELDKRHVLHSWSVQDQISPLPVAGAEGRYFWDYDGNRYLDFASQLVNVSIGHQHPKVVAAIKEQAREALHDRPPDGARDALRARAPARRGHARRPDHVVLHERRRRGERERDQARPLVHRTPQGRSRATAPTTAPPAARSRSPATRGAGPPSPASRASCGCSIRTPTAARPAIRIPCPVCSGAPHFEEILQYEGPQNVAAVIMETIVGTNGIIVPPDGYLESIREVCDRHGIVLILDEVMAGFGRTGKWFGCEQLGRRPRHPHRSPRGSTPATCRSERW